MIVEGPLDVLAITAKIDRTRRELLPVAPCGTACTADHAHQIADVAFFHQSPVVVAMDGDAAGRLAALRTGERLRELGLDVRIAELPNGSDPAEYLNRADATLDVFRAEHGLPLLTVRFQNVVDTVGDRMQWIEGRLAAFRNVAGYLATYPPSYAAHQVSWLADALHLAPSTVTNELAAAYRPGADTDKHPNLTRALSI